MLANDSTTLHPLFLKSMGGEETLRAARMKAGGAQIWRQQEVDGKRSELAERRKEMVEAMAKRPRWRSDPASNSTGLTIAEAAAADKHQREILRQGGSLVSSSPTDMGRLQNAFAFDDLKKHASTGELAQKMAAANMAVYDQLVADQFVEEQLVIELYYQRSQRRTEEQKQHHRKVCLRSQLWCAAIDSPYTLKKRREARERECDRLTALELKPRFRDIEEEIEPLLRFQAAVARFGPDLLPPGPASPSALLEKVRGCIERALGRGREGRPLQCCMAFVMLAPSPLHAHTTGHSTHMHAHMFLHMPWPHTCAMDIDCGVGCARRRAVSCLG